MRVWLVTIGEPLPTDDGNERLLRAGIFAELLSRSGHDVVWWTSAFNHSLKTLRARAHRVETLLPNYQIRMLYGGGYQRNVSYRRLIDHRRLAVEFGREALGLEPPDILVCSFPPIELSLAAVRYANEHHVPVVLDVRDLWPDIFLDAVPGFLRPIGHIAIRRMNDKVSQAFRGATAVWGHAPAFIAWGLSHAGRQSTPLDATFPFGYSTTPPGEHEAQSALGYWKSVGVCGGSEQFIACFVGTVGHQTDVAGIVDAARLLPANCGIKIVVCGVGDRFERLRERAADCGTIFFAGWRRRSEIWTLLRMASVGIAPYVARTDFLSTIPNKVPEYLSAGLAVAVNLSSGRMVDLLEAHDCGFSYNSEPERLATTLRALKSDQSRLERLRTNALSLFEDEFRADKVYSAMAGKLTEIVEACRAARLPLTGSSPR